MLDSYFLSTAANCARAFLALPVHDRLNRRKEDVKLFYGFEREFQHIQECCLDLPHLLPDLT